MNENCKIINEKVSIPSTIYYMKNFITENEQQLLMSEVMRAPKPKWTVLSNRRLQNWGGFPHSKGMVAQPLPLWLQTYAIKLSDMKLFGDNTPNHVLVNEYLSGQGIMPHEDGPLFYPTVATINTGSHTLLDFYPKISSSGDQQMDGLHERSPIFSLLLEPRSLVVLQRNAYESYLHGIQELKSDKITEKVANLSLCDNVMIGQQLERETRLSFTIRYVPKVLKAKYFCFQ